MGEYEEYNPFQGAADEIAALEARVKVLEAALAHISEYWNRDQNTSAMADALYHMIDEADAALTPEPKPEENQ